MSAEPRAGLTDRDARPALVLDTHVRRFDHGRALLGGDPPRLMRLTETGAAILTSLLGETAAHAGARDAAAELLTRKLVDAGIVHVRPQPAPVGEVTVVIPVRDRVRQLRRCLTSLPEVAEVIVVDDGSDDPDAIVQVAMAAGATLVRSAVSGGPAAARNTGLRHVRTDLVAFVDSDCTLAPLALERLCGVIGTDPRIAAVAPRIIAATSAAGNTLAARIAAARCELDVGPDPAWVRPYGRVGYVPTAALLVRRNVLGDGFDEQLRYGEDVDLVWRLLDQGPTVRYEPSAVVRHDDPQTVRGIVARRFRYGTSAAGLGTRHPGKVTHIVTDPRALALLGLVALAPTPIAAAAAIGHIGRSMRRLHAAGIPVRAAAPMTARGVIEVTTTTSTIATTFASPLLLWAIIRGGRARRLAVILCMAGPVRGWLERRPAVDLPRWLAVTLAEDVAYGSGVWAGMIRQRTLEPLRPRLL